MSIVADDRLLETVHQPHIWVSDDQLEMPPGGPSRQQLFRNRIIPVDVSLPYFLEQDLDGYRCRREPSMDIESACHSRRDLTLGWPHNIIKRRSADVQHVAGGVPVHTQGLRTVDRRDREGRLILGTQLWRRIRLN